MLRTVLTGEASKGAVATTEPTMGRPPQAVAVVLASGDGIGTCVRIAAGNTESEVVLDATGTYATSCARGRTTEPAMLRPESRTNVDLVPERAT